MKKLQFKITEKGESRSQSSLLIQCSAILPLFSKHFLFPTYKPLPTVLRIDATEVLSPYSFLPDIKIFLAQS